MDPIPEKPAEKPKPARRKLFRSERRFCSLCLPAYNNIIDSNIACQCNLITSCHCTDYLSRVHKRCLNFFLELSGRKECIHCKYCFITNKFPKGFSDWFAAEAEDLYDNYIVLVLTLLAGYMLFIGGWVTRFYKAQLFESKYTTPIYFLMLLTTYIGFFTLGLSSLYFGYKVINDYFDWKDNHHRIRGSRLGEVAPVKSNESEPCNKGIKH